MVRPSTIRPVTRHESRRSLPRITRSETFRSSGAGPAISSASMLPSMIRPVRSTSRPSARSFMIFAAGIGSPWGG